MGKKEYKQGARQYDTIWLGTGISISNGDLASCCNRNINKTELKCRTPICNWCQVVQYEAGDFHIVVYAGHTTVNGKLDFENDEFQIYCPYEEDQYWEKIERGWLLHGEHHTVSKERAKQILSAREEWSCCQRYSISGTVVRTR